MRIVCWQTILMKYHTLFFFETYELLLENMSSAAVVIGALRVNNKDKVFCSRTQYNTPKTLQSN